VGTSSTYYSFIAFWFWLFYGWYYGLEPSVVFEAYPIYAAIFRKDHSAPILSRKEICMHFCDWTGSFCGVLAGLLYNSVVSPQKCIVVQMHEREEVTPSTSTRKRRYKTSFRYSTMKDLNRAKESKKKAVGISVKKTLTFPEKNQEMGSIVGSIVGEGILEIEEEKDGEDKPVNIIIVSNMSSLISLSFNL
jgi:hypothetical protein